MARDYPGRRPSLTFREDSRKASAGMLAKPRKTRKTCRLSRSDRSFCPKVKPLLRLLPVVQWLKVEPFLKANVSGFFITGQFKISKSSLHITLEGFGRRLSHRLKPDPLTRHSPGRSGRKGGRTIHMLMTTGSFISGKGQDDHRLPSLFIRHDDRRIHAARTLKNRFPRHR